jgi:hypothetical protein
MEIPNQCTLLTPYIGLGHIIDIDAQTQILSV